MNTTAAVDAAVQGCVRHLQEHSEHYFRVVQSKQSAGVLWAVFSLSPSPPAGGPPSDTGAPEGGGVAIRKASYLPLSTVAASSAASLMKMHQACDPKRQFVVWFTVEDEAGDPVVSKVLLVDGDAPPPKQTLGAMKQRGEGGTGWGSHMVDSPPHEARAGRPLRENTVNTCSPVSSQPSPKIQRLKEEMMGLSSLHGSTAASSTTSAARQGADPSSRSTSASHARSWQPAQSTSCSSRRSGSPAASKTTRRERTSSTDGGAGGTNEVEEQRYHHVLRTSLHVADSVAELGSALDEVRSAVQTLKAERSNAPKTPTSVQFDAALARIDALERRQDALHDRIEAFSSVQTRMFEQLQQAQAEFAEMRRETAAAAAPSAKAQGCRRRPSTFGETDGPFTSSMRGEEEHYVGRHCAEEDDLQPVSYRRLSNAAVPTANPVASSTDAFNNRRLATVSAESLARARSRSTQGLRTPSATSSRATSPTGGNRTQETSEPMVPAFSRRPAAVAALHGDDGSVTSTSNTSFGSSASDVRFTHVRPQPSGTSAPAGESRLTELARRGGARDESGAGSSSGAAAGGEESLADMIKNMEQKLTRISLPASTAPKTKQ